MRFTVAGVQISPEKPSFRSFSLFLYERFISDRIQSEANNSIARSLFRCDDSLTFRRVYRGRKKKKKRRRSRRTWPAPCIHHKGLSLARLPSCSPSFLYPFSQLVLPSSARSAAVSVPRCYLPQPTRVLFTRIRPRISVDTISRLFLLRDLFPRWDFSPDKMGTWSGNCQEVFRRVTRWSGGECKRSSD